MDPLTTILLIVGGVIALVVILVLVDLFSTGGMMTMGMMHGTAFMLSNPIGWAILLVLLAMLGVMVYFAFSLT